MKILVLDLGAEWRGGQMQTLAVAGGLAARGHEVRVFALAGAPLSREASGASLTVSEAPPGGSQFSPSLHAALARAARDLAPDVLYAGDGRSHGAAVWSGAARRHPLVVHRRVAFPPSRGPVSRYKYRLPRRFIAVSCAVREALVRAGVPPGKIAVVADGLPAEAFVTGDVPSAPPFRLVHVGAFDGRKGQEIVVGVVARLAGTGWDVHALFLGDGPGRAAVERLARRLDVDDRCTFAGLVSDVPRRLAGSHLLLLPSESEGAPLAIAEAMASGCAVVAHDAGGSGEMCRGGAAGVLLPDLDERRWAAAVQGLLENPGRLAELVAAGRLAADERRIERTVPAIERELHAVIGAPAAA